jgi:UDP-hydrolysing UDP-N-acetyl-D-glucosamine 2-epimerase
MGEESWRVNVVGAPGLDFLPNEILSPEQLSAKYQINLKQPLILVVQHSVVTEEKDASFQITQTLEAIKELEYPAVIIFPNADAGGRRMIEVIKQYQKYSFIKTFVSLPHEDYLGLMKMASVLVGNSSSGIIEAPSFGLPVINIGTRQNGRERGKNVIDVDYNKNEIVQEIQKIIGPPKRRFPVDKLYGDGHAGARITKVLAEVDLGEKLLLKRMTY